MKKHTMLPLLTLILAMIIAGCGPTEDNNDVVLPEDAGIPAVETPAEAETLPDEPVIDDSDAAVDEPNAATTEEEVTVNEPSEAVTEEGATVQEQSEATTEEGVVVEEEAAPETETAQVDDTATGDLDVIPLTGSVNLNRITNLLEFEVWNTNDEQIGAVNAIVIDRANSRIKYVIFGSGGFLGLGETEIPVPWQAIRLQGLANDLENPATETDGAVTNDVEAVEARQNVFILNLTEEQIEQMPEFDLTALYEPQQVNPEADADVVTLEELEQEVQTFWADELGRTGTDEPAEEVAEANNTNNLILADQLLGATIRGMTQIVVDEQPASDVQGDAIVTNDFQPLGLVDEIMVDTETGKVTYLLVTLLEPLRGVPVAPADTLEDAPADSVEQPALGTVQEPITGDIPQAGIEVVPVPLAAVEWDAEENVLFYTGSQMLEEAPIINFDEIDGGNSSWMADADNFWGIVDSDTERK